MSIKEKIVETNYTRFTTPQRDYPRIYEYDYIFADYLGKRVGRYMTNNGLRLLTFATGKEHAERLPNGQLRKVYEDTLERSFKSAVRQAHEKFGYSQNTIWHIKDSCYIDLRWWFGYIETFTFLIKDAAETMEDLQNIVATSELVAESHALEIAIKDNHDIKDNPRFMRGRLRLDRHVQ